MKITSFQAQDIYNTYSKVNQPANYEKPALVTTAPAESKGDKIEISQNGKSASLIEASNLAKKSLTPENKNERAQKVAEIKELIESGKYNVSSMDIARSILKGCFFDQRV